MNIKKTGGPAFPLLASPDENGEWTECSQFTGMTMRDYFAAKAMQGVFSTQIYMDGALTDSAVAEYAYATADAMLKEREK